MIKNKHTPGVWWFNDRFEVGTAPMMEVKVCGRVSGRTEEEAEANARLIAAAPALLVALERLLECQAHTACEVLLAQEGAKAAITRARGGA